MSLPYNEWSISPSLRRKCSDGSRIDFQTGEAILGRCGLAGIFFVGSSLSSS